MSMEGENHYQIIVGGDEQQKTAALAELKDLYNTPDKKLSGYEVKKSPEDIELIKKVESLVDELVVKYGGDPKPVPLDHIYILDEGDMSIATDGKIKEGVHKPLSGVIGVEKNKSKLLFCATLAHELFHWKSYRAAQVKINRETGLYRSGITMIDRKSDVESGDEKEYFVMLEEAIVAMCTQKLIDKIEKDDEFSEESDARKKFMEWVFAYRGKDMNEEQIQEFKDEVVYIDDPQGKVENVLAFSDDETKRRPYATGIFDSSHESDEVEMRERYTERKKFKAVLKEIVQKSGEKFKNTEEVFDEFAKANFSGNYLPLAKIIESILGKGSFRKMAEDFSTTPDTGESE